MHAGERERAATILLSNVVKASGSSRRSGDDAMLHWPEAHKAFRQKQKLNDATDQKFLNVGESKRVQDLLSIAWNMQLRKGRSQEDLQDLFVDTSQSVGRQAWSVGHLRTLTTSSKVYWHGQQRYLLPCEHLVSLGFPRRAAEIGNAELAGSQITDLAAEAMAAPSICTVMMTLIACLPIWDTCASS